jgi:hypothetical protein
LFGNQKSTWTLRKRGYSVGQINFVPPGCGQLFYLRTLLNYVEGPPSFKDIKTVDDEVKKTFKEACYARGFIEDDEEFIDGIVEASHWGTNTFLHHLFVTLLVSKQISRPDVVCNSTWDYLSDDILHRQRRILQFEGNFLYIFVFSFPDRIVSYIKNTDLVLTIDQFKTYTLVEIEICLQSHGSSLDDYPKMPTPDRALVPEMNNRLIPDELNYNVHVLG